MFSLTLSAGTRLKAWNTKPMRLRRCLVNAVSDSRARSVPASHTVPALGRSSPAAQCSRVLLPDPDGPMTAVKVPAKKSRSPVSSARTADAFRP